MKIDILCLKKVFLLIKKACFISVRLYYFLKIKMPCF